MKDISEEAKIPVGLVYTYYKNKEELFDEIVNPIYYYLNLAIEKEEKEEGSALERFKATGEEYVLKLLNQHKSLVILMDKAQGTKHENAKQVFIKILENHIKRQVQKKGIIIEEEILIHILASNFTESLLEIARHYENPDWANVEIFEQAGEENNYRFGATVEELNEIADSYNPFEYYSKDEDIKDVVDSLVSGEFKDDDTYYFLDIYNELIKGQNGRADQYYLLKDFESYKNTHEKLNKDYRNKLEWSRKCLKNIANSGFFSSDRTIVNYADEIWKID